MKKSKKPVIINTREIGIRIFAYNRDVNGCAMQYEDLYSDGSIRVRYGKSVRLNPSGAPWLVSKGGMQTAVKRQMKDGSFRPDLYAIMHVAKLVLTELENACRFVDEPKRKKDKL